MIKHIKNMMVSVFPIISFIGLLYTDYYFIEKIKYNTHTTFSLFICLISVASFFILLGIAVMTHVFAENFFSTVPLIIGTVQCIIFPLLLFVPKILRAFPFIDFHMIYHHNISVNIFVTLTLLTVYILFLITPKLQNTTNTQT